MLAAWFRLKYPHIAMGALASSAPILYFDDIVPQNSYDVVVTKDFQVKINSLYFEPDLIFCAKKLVAQCYSPVSFMDIAGG